jgi:hypothetical protein
VGRGGRPIRPTPYTYKYTFESQLNSSLNAKEYLNCGSGRMTVIAVGVESTNFSHCLYSLTIIGIDNCYVIMMS